MAVTILQQIKKGSVLFAFSIADLMSKSNIVRDGDHLDLYITLPLKAPASAATPTETDTELGSATALTMQNIEIFKVIYDVTGQ